MTLLAWQVCFHKRGISEGDLVQMDQLLRPFTSFQAGSLLSLHISG